MIHALTPAHRSSPPACGKVIEWRELPDGTLCAQAPEEGWPRRALVKLHEAAEALCLDEEQVAKVSLGGVFGFLGGAFDSINVAANGYELFLPCSL